MTATTPTSTAAFPLPKITWEKLPDDFILPDDPVDNHLQPLLAEALREALDLGGLLSESILIATNFGICVTVNDQLVIKAPDWVYVPGVKPLPDEQIRRSYTPQLEGNPPLIILEFISETEGGEYSINPHYPYGKWYAYERLFQIPLYGIFHPKTGELDLYRLVDGKYEPLVPDTNKRFWIPEMNLFLGVWQGQKSLITAHWLRWWTESGELLLWGNEIIAQERERANQAEAQLQREQDLRQRLMERLQSLGIDLEEE